MVEHSHDTPTKDRPSAQAGAADFPNIQSGRYTFVEVIGSGGVGTVYRAHDTVLAKDVAIKKLHNSASETIAIRFQREARLVAALKHENVMSARDFGITDKNEPYMILDFVNGESLTSLLKRSGAMSGTSALDIFIQSAQGIAHAHKNNILHRDIKPSNIMLVLEKDKNGNDTRVAKIVDFGLAKHLDDEQSLTVTGAGYGTPLYMAPEQAVGRGVDQRSDIYSFGCLMFEVLTGHPPFRGRNHMETARLHASQEVPAINKENVSDTLEKIVQKCLSKNPDDRYQGFEELLPHLFQEMETFEPDSLETFEETEAEPGTQARPFIFSIKSQTDGPQRKTKLPIYFIGSWLALLVVALLAYLAYDAASSLDDKTDTVEHVSQQTDNAVRDVIEPKGAFFAAGEFGLHRSSVSSKNSYMASEANDTDLLNWIESDNPEIDQVSLTNCHLTRKGFNILAKNKIKGLVLLDTPTSPTLYANIFRIKSLEAISLEAPHNYHGLSLLANLPRLEQLEFPDQKLTPTFFEELSKFKRMRQLSLAGCTGITPEGLSKLHGLNKSMKELKLTDSDVTDDCLISIIDIPITVIKLDNTAVSDRYLEKLLKCKTLHELTLRHTKVTNRGVQMLQTTGVNPKMRIAN